MMSQVNHLPRLSGNDPALIFYVSPLLVKHSKPPALLGVLSFWLLVTIDRMWDRLTVSAGAVFVHLLQYRRLFHCLTVSEIAEAPFGGRFSGFCG